MKRFFSITASALFLSLFILPGGVFAARTLSLGSEGSDVTVLQDKLISHRYLTVSSTGYFGPATEAALKKFQCANSIICSGTKAQGYGVYGPRTQTAMGAATNYPTNPGSLTGGTMTVAATGAFEISGWIPYWRAATGTMDVLPNLSKLTSVMPFGYTMKTDGTLVDTADLTEEPWSSFITLAKQAKVRVIPTVMWGNGEAIHQILSDAKKRASLEDQIVKVVKENNWDGIDIDFEAKKRETINYFSMFMKSLYKKMGNKWVYCTVEARMPLEHRYLPGQTVPPDATDYANDYKVLNQYCDRVEIMAYDQGTIDQKLNAVRQAPYAPVADTEWVEALVRLAAQTISRNKLIVGIPTYGYEYKVTPISGGVYQYKVLWPFNYKYATDIAQKLNITPFRNSAGELGFVYYPTLLETAPSGTDSTLLQNPIPSSTITHNANGSNATLQPFNYVSWSDAVAIQAKVDLAKRLGVRGVAVFKFDGGEDQAMWNVLK